MRNAHSLALACVAAVAATAVLSAQSAPSTAPKPAPAPKNYGTLFLRTNVGAFKILRPTDEPAEGKVEMSFTGAVLISGLKGNVQPNANVRLELNKRDRNKRVYFSRGGGKLVITGKFEGIQFFGRNLNAVYNGWGVVRLYGEFDRQLETGEYWYANDTTRRPWGTGGMTVTTSPPAALSGPTPGIRGKVRDVGKG